MMPRQANDNRPSPAAWASLKLIRLYQLTLSSVLGTQCRFYPTCSHYTAEAITRHGAARGILLGALRIFRCHPWYAGGHDPVPKIWPDNILKKGCGCSTHIRAGGKAAQK